MLSRSEENGGGMVVVLDSCEGLIEGETESKVAPLPAEGIINTNLVVHVDVV